MKIRHALAAATLALVGLGAGAANAATIYQEDFNAAGFRGTPIISYGAGSEASSDRWFNTNYYNINNFDSWTFAGSSYYAEQTTADGILTGDGALLLNETTGVGTVIVGLTVGKTYSLSFLLWGDNRPGQDYALDVSIGSLNSTINGTDGAAGSNPAGTPVTYSFTANSSTQLLRFAQATSVPSQASPIVDNIVISAVPEPAIWAMMLLGFGSVGFMMRGARRKQAALTA